MTPVLNFEVMNNPQLDNRDTKNKEMKIKIVKDVIDYIKYKEEIFFLVDF